MNIHRIFVITKKELHGLANEKTILLAILLQLFIALFSSFLMVGLSAMYDPSTYGSISGVKYGVGIVGNDTILTKLLDENPSFKPYQMNLSVALGALKERKLAAVIWTSETLPENKDPVSLTLYTIKNDIQSAVIEVKIKDVFLKYEEILRDVRSDRITRHPVTLTSARVVTSNTFYEFIYALLIPLLLFMPAIISAGLVIDLITEEYQQQTIDTLRTTPASLNEIIWGKISACVILVPMEAGLWLVLLILNRIQIGSLPEILLQVFFASSALILVAAVLALYYQDRTKSQFIFSTASVILLLLILAFPGNPLNIVAQLASNSPAPLFWPVLLTFICICILLTTLIGITVKRTTETS